MKGSDAAARPDFERFFAAYVAAFNRRDAQGVAEAHKTVLAAEPLFPGLWLAQTADRTTDAAGGEMLRWEHVYLLAETEGGRRAMIAVADGEVAAWEARGTPLGSGWPRLQVVLGAGIEKGDSIRRRLRWQSRDCHQTVPFQPGQQVRSLQRLTIECRARSRVRASGASHRGGGFQRS